MLLENLFAYIRKGLSIAVVPIFTAVLLRRFFPSVHRFLVGLKDMAFYLWALALIIVMGQTTRSVVEGNISVGEELLIAFWALVVCVLQFWLGKYIGGRHDNRISGGQALGQKIRYLQYGWHTLI